MRIKHYLCFALFALLFTSCELIENLDRDKIDAEDYILILDAESQSMSGLVADGYSQLEFAIPYDADAEVVEISISPLSEAWGVIDDTLSDPVEKSQLLAYRFTLTSEESLPTDLQSGDSAVITYTFDVTTSDGETTSYERDVTVVRTPVVFVHGMASDATTYDTMLSYITPKGLYLADALYAADYQETSLSTFETNKDVIPNAITHMKSAMAESGIICERVSIIGHSMGGILSRMYMQGRSSVAYRDDIHKLICVNTPHSGSQLADFAIAFGERDPDGVIATIAKAGAIVDLAVLGDAIAELNSAANLAIEGSLEVPTHIVTSHIGTLSDVAELVKDEAKIAALVTFALNAIEGNLLYDGDSSDIVVPTESQEGGLKSGLINNHISTYSNEWHCSILSSEELATKIVTILDAKRSSSYFTTDGFDPKQLTFDSSSLEGSLEI